MAAEKKRAEKQAKKAGVSKPVAKKTKMLSGAKANAVCAKSKPARPKGAWEQSTDPVSLKGKATASRFELDDKVQRQKEVAWRLIDGEAVIITPEDSTMHSLNDSGTRIWELITGNRSLREVADVINTEFEVGLDRAQKDTLWFVDCLAKKGLVGNTK